METYIYILIEIGICILISIILVFYYSRKGTNPLALITAGFTWSLNFILIVFLPFDIYYTYSDIEEDKVIHNILAIGYKFLYWTLFFCSWIFVPLMQEYEDSGDFTKKRKFIRSIKNNIIFYIILAAIALVFLIITLIYFKFQIESFTNFVNDLMYCSYLIGLLLFYFLIGYSIINLPIKTFNKVNYTRQIKYLEWRAITLKKSLEKIQKELVDDGYLLQSTLENFNIMKRVNKSKSLDDEEIEEDKDNQEKQSNKNEKSRNSSFSSSVLTDYSQVITERFNYLYDNADVFGIDLKRNNVDNDKEPLNNVEELIKLNRKINKNEWDNLRIQIRIRNQYKHWLTLSTVMYELKKENKNIEITSTAINDEKLLPSENSDSSSEEINNIVEDSFIPRKDISQFKIFYFEKIRRPFLIIYASIIVICSLIFIISQIGAFFKFSIYGKIVKAVIKRNFGIFGLHFFIMIPIIFLFIMSIYTFFKLKISGYFYMYKNRQTDSVTLMYFSTNLCRISFSICLDFIFNIKVEFDKDIKQYENDIQNQTNPNSTINSTYTIINFLTNNLKNNTNLTTQIQYELNFDEEINLFFKIYKYGPLILGCYVLILIFKIPQRIAKLCGKKIFESESDDSMNEIKEGHDYYMEINKKYDGGVLPKEKLILPKDKYDR